MDTEQPTTDRRIDSMRALTASISIANRHSPLPILYIHKILPVQVQVEVVRTRTRTCWGTCTTVLLYFTSTHISHCFPIDLFIQYTFNYPLLIMFIDVIHIFNAIHLLLSQYIFLVFKFVCKVAVSQFCHF